MRVERIVLFLSVVCLASGCKGSRKEASAETKQKKAELSPPAAKQLQTIAGLAAKVKATPDDFSTKELAKLPYRDKIAIVGEEWLEDPTKSAGDLIDLHDSTLYVCKSSLDHPMAADDDIPQLEKCIGLEHVAVIRKRWLTPPDVDEDLKTFKPGTFAGQVLVFDLPKGDLVATYSLQATNTDKLELTGEPTGGHWHREAMRDLSQNTMTAAEQLFQKPLPPP